MKPEKRGLTGSKIAEFSQRGPLQETIVVFSVGLIGLYLTKFWYWGSHPEGLAIVRYLGWIMVVYALIRLPALLRAFYYAGFYLFFFLVVAALAYLVGGDSGLWTFFF